MGIVEKLSNELNFVKAQIKLTAFEMKALKNIDPNEKRPEQIKQIYQAKINRFFKRFEDIINEEHKD